MSAIRCLSSDELRDFVLGQTDDARSEQILTHLSECPACEDTVASLDDTADSLVVSVRQAIESDADADASGAGDPLAVALASVRSQFAPSVTDPPVDESMSRIVERIRDYELLSELGSGGMGTVYKAVHTKLDRTVALKLLPARRLRDRDAVSRFEREMKAIGRLDHSAIVRATDAGEVDGTHFLAMDFVDGIDLGKLVRLVGPLDPGSACELIRQAAIGLQYAHEQGLIHRDVKPSNLMVEKGGETRAEGQGAGSDSRSQTSLRPSALDSQPSTIRILDLGLALFGSASEAVDELTTVGQLMGTLDYMAPEQADNSHAVDARADVYSLGATLFKLLTGMAPYETGERCSPLQKMKALATTDPPPLASRREELPDGLAAIVDRMLLRDPDERFQSAAEVADALTPFCDGQAIDDLVECGVHLAEQQRQAEQSRELAAFDEPIGALEPNRQSAALAVPTSDRSERSGNVQHDSSDGTSRGTRWLLWSMLTAIALLAGITIWIQTDTGTLKIECADENVPIEIRNSSGKVVQSETLTVGQNEIVIHSGSYEIVLPKDYDELKVENGKYELTRGGEWIARVTRQSHGVAHTGSVVAAEEPLTQTVPEYGVDVNKVWPLGSNLPGRPGAKPSGESLVFSGRTFEEWQQSVLTERNPEELKSAVMALCILGRQNRDREAAETVLKVTDAYPCEISNSPEGELVAASIRYLRTLDAVAIVPAIIEALKDRGTNTRRLIVEHLAAGVMYGGGSFGGAAGGAVSIPNTGKAEPLQSRLVKSPEYRKTLVELFPKFAHDDPETSTLRYVAFQQIEGFLDDASLETEIDGLLEDIYRKRDAVRVASTTPGPFYLPRAVLHLTRRSPRPELATYFLDNLERTYPNPDNHDYSYTSDWYGLWLLGDKAEGESDRIAKLLTARLPGTYHPSPVQATTVPTAVAGWGNPNAPRQTLTRKVLVLDLLATIGPGAKSAVPAVIDEIEALTGQRPIDDGDYGYEANDPRTFFVQFEAPFSHGLTGSSQTSGGFFGGGGGFGEGAPATGGGFFNVSDVGPEVGNREPITMPEPWLRLNAALRALKSLTGKTPRFATLKLIPKQTEAIATASMMGVGVAGTGGSSGAAQAGSGYPGGGLSAGYGGEFGMDGGKPVDAVWLPKLVSYRGKRFDEWAETSVADSSIQELADVCRAFELLGGSEQPGVTAAGFARVFEAAMSRRGEITEADRQVIHDAFRDCWLSNDGPARGKLLQAIFNGTPQRTALVLTEIVAPSLDLTKPQPTTDLTSESPAPLNIEWAAPNAITRELVFAGPFGARYQNLVDGWDKHGPELRAAILHVEAQLPALKQVNRTDLLQKLIDGGSPQEKLATALIVARIDLSKQRDAPPRVRNRDKTFAETPALQSRLKQAAIEALVEAIRGRRAEVDWVNAVPALASLSRDKLDAQLASEFVELILADSAQADAIGPFSIRVNHPQDPVVVGNEAMGSGMEGSGAMSGMGGYGGAMGFADPDTGRVTGGVPGLGLGVAPGMAGGGFPGGGVGMEGGDGAAMESSTKLPPVTLTLSRRILLCELLGTVPPADEKLRDRLAEQLAPLLRGRGLEEVMAGERSQPTLTTYWQQGATYRGMLKSDAAAEEDEFVQAAAQTFVLLASVEKLHKLLGINQPVPVGAAPGKPTGESATYEGRTYAEWLADVRRERSPDKLSDSLTALTTLGAGTHDAEIAQEILGIVSRLKITQEDRGPPENAHLLKSTAAVLNQVSPEIVIPLFVDAVRSGKPEMIWYATELLLPKFSLLKWNAIHPDSAEPVSVVLYNSPEFRDALLSVWAKVAPEVRPQFVVAASLFVNVTPPEGELPDTEFLKWLADVAGSDDAEAQLPSRYGGTSLKLHACRALAQIYPECPELPQWTMDALEPYRQREGSQWWNETANGWVALKLMNQHAAGQTDRLAEWIAETDEEYTSTIELMWITTSATGGQDSRGIAIPRRLVMLEVLTAIADRGGLGNSTVAALQSLRTTIPQFAAEAMENSRGVERAETEYAHEIETSSLDTLVQIRESAISSRFEVFDSGLSTLDAAWLVVAYRRCQKLIAELLGEAPSAKKPSTSDTKPE